MQGKRTLRIRQLLHHEISHLLTREMKDPRLGFVSVTRVEVTDDLQHAKVFVSFCGKEADKKGAFSAMEGAAGFIRGKLGKKLRLKQIPHLTFLLDKSAEYSIRISKMLKEMELVGNEGNNPLQNEH